MTSSELFADGHALHHRPFRNRKLSIGYIRDVARTGAVRWGIGGVVGLIDVPAALDASYGARPRSYLLFLQGRL